MSAPSDLPHASDQDLVKGALEGRPEAQRELVERYYRPVYQSIRRIVGHRERARDLTQETFFEMFDSLADYRPEEPFWPWLHGIANHIAHGYARIKRPDFVTLDTSVHSILEDTSGRIRALHEDEPPEPPEPPASTGQSTPATVDDAAFGRALKQAVTALRGVYRVCFIEHYAKGRSYQDLAAKLELPIGTVKSYAHRAKKQVRATLDRLVPGWRRRDLPSAPA
jgi:RNA polymerase sigma-70 factor (ECF subfamily)